MTALVSNMLYQFHYIIVDPATRVRYSVWDLLESVRAVRDVSCGCKCDTQDRTHTSGYIPVREEYIGTTSGHRKGAAVRGDGSK